MYISLDNVENCQNFAFKMKMNVMVFGKSTILWILKSLISSFIDHGVLKFGNWLPHEIHQKLKGPRIIRFF